MAKKKTMKKESSGECMNCCCSKKSYSSSGGMGYCLGFLGALVYYMSVASGFVGVIVGIFKALLWPAFLVFAVMKFLGM